MNNFEVFFNVGIFVFIAYKKHLKIIFYPKSLVCFEIVLIRYQFFRMPSIFLLIALQTIIVYFSIVRSYAGRINPNVPKK